MSTKKLRQKMSRRQRWGFWRPPEFAVGLQAALDSPIIGHGSWAKDMKYLEMLTTSKSKQES